MKHPALIDVPVLLIFFSRPELFKQVFNQVRKARPSKLLLYQDGPRIGNINDQKNIEKCRRIAEEIDWECEVFTNYQEMNNGCDPSGYIAQTWAFSLVDKCIVLEDDVVPSITFFEFCKILLDKYENDERISLITGINYLEVFQECHYDYFFSSCSDIWGWATWKRVVDTWDKHYNFINDDYDKQQLRNLIRQKKLTKNFINICMSHRDSQKEHFETILISNQLLNSGLTIVPKKNMINNIGVTTESTHFSGNLSSLPKGYRKIFTMNRYDLSFPLKHPKYIVDNVFYKEMNFRIKGWGHPIIKIYRLFESTFYRIVNGDISGALRDITKKIYKLYNGLSS